MEEMQETEDFYSRKKQSNENTLRKEGQVSGLGMASALPGMYLMSRDMASSPGSGAKPSLSQSRDSKWDPDKHELKEMFNCRHTQPCELHHHDTPHLDKSMKNRGVLDAAQVNNFNDFDMFPPLGTQLQMFKSGKGPVGANRHTEQHEVVKISSDKGHEECIRINSSQTKTKKSFEASQGENKSEWKAPSFWNIKREKAFFPQASDRRETVASLHECSEPSLPLQSNMRLNKSVKEWNVTVPGGELCLSIAQKTNVNGGYRRSIGNNEHSTRTVLFPRKTLPDYLLGPEKSYRKKMSSPNLCLSLEKNANANKTAEDLDTCSGKGFQISDNQQHSNSVLDHILSKNDASDSSECTELSSFTEKGSAFPSKCTIISYLKVFLKSQELQSLSVAGNSPESKCLSSPECSSASDSLTEHDTAYVAKTCMSEEKLLAEYDKVCEEMLHHYIVISSFPCDLTRGDVFHHISKVGTVSYFIMDGNRAHVIFLKAEDAETAFSLRHELCGEELVVYRPRRPSCTLYLGGLTSNTSNEEVIQVISEYGVILGFYRPLHKLSNGPAGYCFIKVDRKVAEDILKQSSLVVNNVKIFAEVSSQSEVKLSPKMSSTQQPGSILPSSHSPGSSEEYKVMFTDVPHMASYDLIKEHFQEFGRLQKVFLRNRKGFVIFASRDSLEQALSTRHTIMGSEMKLSRGSLFPEKQKRNCTNSASESLICNHREA